MGDPKRSDEADITLSNEERSKDEMEKEGMQKSTDITINQSNVIIGNGKILQVLPRDDATLKHASSAEEASSRLKLQYRSQLGKWTVPVIKADKGFHCVEKDREQFMVHLRIVEGRTDDGDFNEMSRYMEAMDTSADSVTPAEIFVQGGGRVFLRGVAGVGKTSYVEHLALSWANGKLYTEFDFLFLFKCRNLIKYKDKAITTEFLFEDQFNVNVPTLKQVVEGKRVLVIIDGLDELPSLETIFEGAPNWSLNSILNSLMRKESAFFPGHKCIMTGRPHIQTVLLKRELLTIGKLNIFEITGFTREATIAYVDNFTAGNKEIMTHILSTIQESASLRAMASIPQFLSSLCGILATKTAGNCIHRITELYIWVLVSFMRQHFAEFQEMPYKILKDSRFRNFVIAIAKISYDLLIAKKLVFKEDDFSDVTGLHDPVEKKILDSFFCKIETTTECLYQFKHVSLQEFLAGVHCFRAGISIKELLDKKMYVMMGFVAGLARANEHAIEEPSNVVSMFVHYIQIEQGWGEFLVIESRPTVESIAIEIFHRVRQRKITWQPFFAIFFELTRKGDKLPCKVAFVDVIEFSFDSLSAIECVHFVHCMTVILESFGENSLKLVTLRLINSKLTMKKTNDLAILLKHVYKVRFIACEIDVDFVDSMSKSIVESTGSCQLAKIAFSNCNLSDGHFSSIATCLRFIDRLELWYNDLTLTGASAMAKGLLDYQHCESVQLNELRFHGCKFNDEVMPCLCKIIPILEVIDFTRCCMNEYKIGKLVDCISSHKNKPGCCRLEVLVLERCELNDACIKKLCRVIAHLRQVNLSRSMARLDCVEYDSETIEQLARSLELAHENNELYLKQLALNSFPRNEETKQRFGNFNKLGIEVTFASWPGSTARKNSFTKSTDVSAREYQESAVEASENK